MLATARKNLELTMASVGKHHMADFLPEAELKKFLAKAEAKTTGGVLALDNSSDSELKIDESNVGYQLLKKSGWSAGEGLGLEAKGIVEPITATAGGAPVESAGIGVHATHEVEVDDDAFDQYRKRMMLAYRFRPNPLNNPRRDYY